MTTEQTGNSGSQTGPPADEVARQYIGQQVDQARVSLRRARIVSVIAVLVVLGYFGFLTWFITSQYLRPKKAAEAASQFAGSWVQDNGPLLAGKLKKEIPAMIRGAPDYALKQLPKWREQLEEELEGHFTRYCSSSAAELTEHLDTFLEENKESLDAFLEAARQSEGSEALGEALEDEIRLYLEEPGDDGESIGDKLRESLKVLHQIQSHLEHLVSAKKLSPQDQKLRHAIAVIMKTVDREVTPIEIKAIVP